MQNRVTNSLDPTVRASMGNSLRFMYCSHVLICHCCHKLFMLQHGGINFVRILDLVHAREGEEDEEERERSRIKVECHGMEQISCRSSCRHLF